MSLYKIQETVILNSSGVNNIILGDSNWDDSFDVYKLDIFDLEPLTDGTGLNIRFRTGGSSISSADYHLADENMQSDASFSLGSSSNADKVGLFGMSFGSQPSVITLYLFNFNSSSSYSLISYDSAFTVASGSTRGRYGGSHLDLVQSHNGVDIFTTASDGFKRIKCILYGIK
mgnify:CR=1 FL=1|tara:strand:- start:112 stop:630 length:519 start_codon:yes stop_codon:yes gene_type:complete